MGAEVRRLSNLDQRRMGGLGQRRSPRRRQSGDGRSDRQRAAVRPRPRSTRQSRRPRRPFPPGATPRPSIADGCSSGCIRTHAGSVRRASPRTVTIENGKTLEEARGEVLRAVENVEVAAGIPTLQQGSFSSDISAAIDEHSIREPLGVFAQIGPFNFPAMVPFWFGPLAVACGNTFVTKPSQKTPLSQTLLTELTAEAGFPPGVMNLVHGEGEQAQALSAHPDVMGVSFVGSTPVARAVYETATQKRQTGAVPGRGQEPPGRAARRRPGRRDSQHLRLDLRLRRPKMPGRVGGGDGRRGTRGADGAVGRGDLVHSVWATDSIPTRAWVP